ncbi:LamG-like jellyroll fold domain-containing protein [Phytohabitans flavus]
MLVVALTASLGGGGVSGSGARGKVPAGDRDPERRHSAGPSPAQQWGSAAGRSHLAGGSVNRSLPRTLRGQYPLHSLGPGPERARNVASVAEPSMDPVRGFDRATSRERPGERQAHERVYDNADGSQTTEFSLSPLNYQDRDGTWQPIDNDLVASPGGAGWHNAADGVDVRLAPRADDVQLAQVTLDGSTELAFGLAGAAASAGRLGRDGVTYAQVRPGVDLRLAAQAGGVKETLVLHSAGAPHSYLFPLRLRGLTASLDGGQVVLTDQAGQRRAVIPAGYMLDAGTATTGPAMSTGVTYRLVTEAGGPALRVDLDSAWLRHPDRRYPIEVDPTVGPPVDAIGSDTSMYVHGGSSTSGSSELLVGRMDGANAAAYLRFGSLVDRLRDHTIYGAALSVVNYDAPSCRARPVTVHPVTESWSGTSGHAYPGPSVGGALASRSFAHGYVAFGQSQSACPAAGEMFDLGVAGRNLVQRWANGQQANNGLSLRASSTDSGAWKRFGGTGTPNAPKLYVTHTPYNATYSIPRPTPDPPVLQNQDGKVQIIVTNRGAEAWTPGSYYLAYRAYNAQTGRAVTQQRSASLPGNVARGASVTLDATIKALPPGAYFLDFTMVRSGGIVFTDHQVPPGRIVLQVVDVPPVVQELHPPNGYQAPTLTPVLWAQAVDSDAPPNATLQYKFELCDRTDAGEPTNCVNSGYQAKPSWPVPAGRLAWSKSYSWRAYVKDANNEVISPYSVLLASVPQPEIISRIAGAPYAEQGKEFDAQVGNYSTAAIDATVATVGPELNLLRTYNSLDPRPAAVFGAGWSSRYDMKLAADNDGSGSVVIRYPDGQEVRFGRNPDGSYAAPSGRVARLTLDSAGWKLLDRSGTTYFFSLAGKLTKITDNSSHSIVISYDTTGKLTKAQVSNSLTNTAGRALHFTWSGSHIGTVSTDPVNGAALTWTYTYDGDLLTKVCAPDAACTSYEYSTGSHYRTAVLDARPDSYYRLGEKEGTGAASEVAVNLGKDAGTYRNVTLGQPGVMDGTTAAAFNGTSSHIQLPKGMVKKNRDAAVELWFKIGVTQTGGPLLGYQDTAVGTPATSGVPILYTGTDGRLRGQFAGGAIAPITSAAAVNDNKWHHAVLSAMGTTQTMYLDGVKVGEVTGRTIEHTTLTHNQLGAASATTPSSWPAWGATAQRYFAGLIDEAAVYAHPLGQDTVAAHYRYTQPAPQQLTRVTLPTGRVAAEVEYDAGNDRVKEYTDGNGGTWKIGLPTVYGGNTDLRRSVQVLDPGNRPHLYEYDAISGRMLRTGTPLGLEIREEDRPGEPTTPPEGPPTETCSQPDPGDPAFCTVIPDSAGGPVFIRHPVDGMAIRTFSYDDKGYQNKVTNENGDSVEMTYDARGNLASRKTCRTSTQCFTAHYKYSTTVTSPFDPRSELATESRDARSSSATDTTYRTSYVYGANGQLASQVNPDGSTVSHTYTTGVEGAVDRGNVPSGLLASSTDARQQTTRHAYYTNGDLARTTGPSGVVTEYTYDTIGRLTSEKEISDSYPAGVVTTYTYDTRSRPATVTGPVTTDPISGARHQARSTNEYDLDGNQTKVTLTDLLGTDPARVSSTEYDEYNRPSRVVDAEGNETTYGYDRFGNKTTMVDANGNRYDWAYTAQNKVAEVRLRDWRSDPDGSPGTGTGDYLVLHSYSYDFAGRLASDTDAMGRRLEYQYYRDDLLHKVVLKDLRNPDGSKRDYVVEENTYDGAGNLTRKVELHGKRVTEQSYDRAGKLTATVLDPTGLRHTSTYAYDGNGNVTRTTQSGTPSNVPWTVVATPQAVEYAYDNVGNVVEEKVVAGTDTRVTSYTYDRRGLRLSTTDPRGNVPGADKRAFTTTYAYDELGRQVQVTGPAVAVESGGVSGGTVSPTSTVGYNAFDEQVAVRDPRGRVSRVEYDRLGRPVHSIAPTYLPPGASLPITPQSRTAYDGLGNVVEETGPRGSTRYTYDQLSRMTSRDDPTTTDDDRAVTRYTYTRTGEVLSATGPTGTRVENTYDDLDRQITSTAVERRPTTRNLTTRMVYDDLGNVTSVSSPSGATTTNIYDTLGALVRTTAPTGEATLFGYDHSGRQIRVSDGLGRTVKVAYDLFGNRVSDASLKADGTVLRSQTYGYDVAGNLTSATDPYQSTTTYRYDAADRLVEQVEPVSATESITTRFGYDEAGARTRYTDGRGNATIYTYNTLGLPESVLEPATSAHPAPADRTWTVSYDADANPIRANAPGGVSRQRTYDVAGRLTGETGSGAEAATAARTLGYDDAGRLTSVSAPNGTNTYAYNDRGALLSTAGPSGTASFDYDDDGNLTSRTDASGTATFGYVKGRLDWLTDGITGQRQQLTYDAAGGITTVNYGGGRLRTFGYDDYGRINNDELRNGAGRTVASVAYQFDLNGHLTGKNTTGTAGAGNNSYTYDRAGRLTSWTGPNGTVTYAWDAAGNRVRNGSKTAVFDERNRLTSDGDYTYTYTPRGTRLTRTSSGLAEQYASDAFDRLVSSEGQAYGYDGLDRLVARSGLSFQYAGLSDDVVTDGTEYYSRGPSNELLAVGRGADRQIPLVDAHGDVVAAFDPADTGLPALEDSTTYDPFGKKVDSDGQTGNLGFQGDWTDPDTGKVDMGARWYEPEAGAFTSRDTANYSSGDSILANRYTYGAGAPLDFDDPDGQWPKFLNRAASVARSIVRPVWNGVKAVWNSSWVQAGWSALKTAGGALLKGAVKIGLTVIRKAGEGIAALRSGNFKNWAAQQARAAQKKYYEAKAAVTKQARAAIAHAVKFTRLPVVKALLAPIVAGAKIVSVGVKFAAKVVSVSAQAIRDPEKFKQDLWRAATEKLAPLVEGASAAWDNATQFVEDHAATIAGIAVGAVVGIGCGVAIGWTGVGAVACGALAGAIGSAVTGYMNGERGLNLLKTTAIGGLTGALGGALGSIGGQALGAGIRALSGGFRAAGQSALGAARAEISSIASGRLSGGLLSSANRAGTQSAARAAGGSCPIRGNSFAPGTPVLTADGDAKPIENVRVGELVLATDPTTGKTEAQPVTATIRGTGEKHLVEITIDVDGSHGDRTATIVATDGHPIWQDHDGNPHTPGGRWIDAVELRQGQWLKTADGRLVRVAGTHTQTQHATVYNLTVDTLHTYYVVAGDQSVLVHNCGGTASTNGRPHSTKCTCADGGDPRIPPNPYGKAGGPAHQNVMDNVARDLESQGFTVRTEVRFDTPGGFYPFRFADVVAYDSDGNLVSLHQVGLQTKGGIPAIRETRAMSDIWSVIDDGVDIVFHPYGTVK